MVLAFMLEKQNAIADILCIPKDHQCLYAFKNTHVQCTYTIQLFQAIN